MAKRKKDMAKRKGDRQGVGAHTHLPRMHEAAEKSMEEMAA